MTKDERNKEKLQQINDKINVIESTLQTLTTELQRLKAKRERLLNKQARIKSDSDLPENTIEIVCKKEINNGEVTTLPEENGVGTVLRKKSRKKWAENNYVIEYSDSHTHAIVKKKKRKHQESDQTYIFDEQPPTTSKTIEFNESENLALKSDCSIYTTPPNSLVKINKFTRKQQWRRDTENLKDELKVGILKLDFKGANIDRIPGYGEMVHFQ